MSEGGHVSAISRINRGLVETGEVLERAIGVMFFAAALVVIPCVAALLVAFTFAVIHNGDDFTFDNGSHGEGDVIVLPPQVF
jgi:hypothetical protein